MKYILLAMVLTANDPAQVNSLAMAEFETLDACNSARQKLRLLSIGWQPGQIPPPGIPGEIPLRTVCVAKGVAG